MFFVIKILELDSTTNSHANLDDGLLSGEYLEEPLGGDPLDPRHCGDPPLAPLGDPPLGDSLLALKEVHISKIKQGCKINLKFIFLPPPPPFLFFIFPQKNFILLRGGDPKYIEKIFL